MPTFQLNKMIRDDMIAMYGALGQKAVYRKLEGDELIAAIIQKIVEEAEEIPADGDRKTIIKEIADVKQGLIDLQAQLAISDDEIEQVRVAKLAEKGGFMQGIFVETLTLRDDDSWVAYYRAEPEKYPEISGE